MKILIVVPQMPTDLESVKGGVHAALTNLLEGFKYEPIQIRLVSFSRSIKAKTEKQYSENIVLVYYPQSNLPHVINYLLKGAFQLRHEIQTFHPDLVHYFMSGYILLTRLYGLLGKPVLATIHGIAFAEARLKKQLKEKIVFYTNGWVELLLCPKNKIHLSNYSLHLHTTQQKDLTTIIPNAVKSTFFELPIKSSTENKLLFVGVIEHNKNLMYLLHCLAELNQQGIFFTLDVLGDFADADYKKNTLELIERAQLSKAVKFHGWVKQDQVLKFLQESDLLVIPSLQETLPMAIAEAMAAGKVVAASKTGGIPEMIDKEKDGQYHEMDNMKNNKLT